jgi:hypothetical protein
VVAITLRLNEEQANALRRRTAQQDRSLKEVVLAALDDYLSRVEDDELSDRLAQHGAERFADLLRRLGDLTGPAPHVPSVPPITCETSAPPIRSETRRR